MRAMTVGSATVDVIATVASDDIERMTLHNSTSSFLLLEPGRKVDASTVQTHVGGGAVNAAVALSRLGFEVSALVKVGDDHNAEKVRERLVEEKVGVENVRVSPDEQTAVSVMIASHDRNAAIFTHRGANGFLTAEDIEATDWTGVDLVYVTNLSNASADRFPEIVAAAKANGAFVSGNPGIRQLTTRTTPFFDSLANVDLFSCNLAEARALVPAIVERTGWSGGRGAASDAGPVLSIEGFHMPLVDYAKRLHGLGPRFVAVTDGENGAYLCDGGILHHVPAVKRVMVGSAGAGDAFASTLSAGLVAGLEPVEAAQRAATNSASVIAQLDAQSGLLTADQLADAGTVFEYG